MKLAVVLSDLSWPPKEGLHQQSGLLLSGLVQQGHDIDLYILGRNTEDIDLESFVGDTGLVSRPTLIADKLPAMLGGFLFRLKPRRLWSGDMRQLALRLEEGGHDIVYLEGARACGLVNTRIAARSILNIIDPGSRRKARLALVSPGLGAKIANFGASLLAFLYERAIDFEAAEWIVVSREDEAYLKRIHGHVRTRSIPVILPPEVSAEPATGAQGPEGRMGRPVRAIIFADLRQPHMQVSFHWLMEHALVPRQKECADITFEVVGRVAETPALRAACGDLHVIFHEWVKDYVAFVASADIVILPDRVGTGLKNRTVQALSLAKAVVGTSVSFEGVPAQNGVHGIIEDDSGAFGAAVVGLARDADRRATLGVAGKSFADEFYSVQSVMVAWKDVLDAVRAASASGRASPIV